MLSPNGLYSCPNRQKKGRLLLFLVEFGRWGRLWHTIFCRNLWGLWGWLWWGRWWGGSRGCFVARRRGWVDRLTSWCSLRVIFQRQLTDFAPNPNQHTCPLLYEWESPKTQTDIKQGHHYPSNPKSQNLQTQSAPQSVSWSHASMTILRRGRILDNLPF